jgi:hypothetical protein
VRVVSNREPEIAARNTGQRSDRAAAVANARVNGTSPSRAPEMNRSPAKANAQYLRSAGFAHQGVVPGSERSTTAQSRANANARVNARASEQGGNRGARISSSNRAAGGNNVRNDRTVTTQGHLSSSNFAHTQGGRGTTTTLRDNQAQRRAGTATSNARVDSGS